MCYSGEIKEIRRFKIAVNAACPLRCGYCFLDKDSGEALSWEQARAALELALGSPGKAKSLLIYGGEPLLNLSLVDRMARWARARARRDGISLTVSVATSGLGVTPQALRVLRRVGARVAVSLDGEPAEHDRHRVGPRGGGSYAAAAEGARRLLAALPRASLTALVAAPPASAGGFDRAVAHALSLGFDAFNPEVIRGVPWSGAQAAAFAAALERGGDAVVASSRAGRFVFAESSYGAVLGRRAPEVECPFRSSLETFPDGSYSFYPYPVLSGAAELSAARVGGAEDGLAPRWRDCRYRPSSALCRGCVGEYYRLPRPDEGRAASEVRAAWSRRLASRLRAGLPASLWRRYRAEAARRAGAA